MAHTILTVDDSKTIRMIVAKTLRPFDCRISEAANGAEGLEAAARDKPDLIILDITMPVMDGVEMLEKLKADPALKGVPVMMLTAESGRDNVLKIANLGVRDYLVKPFKEEQLLEKAAKILNLQLKAGPRAKTLEDAAIVLVVEDKSAIVQQIAEGLRSTPWMVVGKSSPAEALASLGGAVPDAIIISLSLPGDGGFSLLQQLKGHPAARHVPALGMFVKTDSAAALRAEQAGFAAVVTKPIDVEALRARLVGLMNLDTASRYCAIHGDVQVVVLPDAASIGAVAGMLKPTLTGMVDAGLNKLLLDLTAVKVDSTLITFITGTLDQCRELSITLRLAGAPPLATALKSFQETNQIPIDATVEEARSRFPGASADTTLSAAGR